MVCCLRIWLKASSFLSGNLNCRLFSYHLTRILSLRHGEKSRVAEFGVDGSLDEADFNDYLGARLVGASAAMSIAQ